MTPSHGAACFASDCLTSADLKSIFALLGGLLEIAGFTVAWLRLRTLWQKRWPGQALFPRTPSGRVESGFTVEGFAFGHTPMDVDTTAPVSGQLEAIRAELDKSAARLGRELANVRREFADRLAEVTSAESAKRREADAEAREDTKFALTVGAGLAGVGLLLQLVSVFIEAYPQTV